MFGLSKEELSLFRKLNTPGKIQDFLEILPINFEKNGETCMSPRRVLKNRKAHCIEGAMLAAAVLRVNGYKPLVMDLKAVENDEDHVIAVLKKNGYWGTISKTNHAVLKYREPIYRTIRELALSFFHEYHKNGRKTLRSYSRPFNLSYFDKINWMTSEKDLWQIPEQLDEVAHKPILSRSMINSLRKADAIEVKAGDLIQF